MTAVLRTILLSALLVLVACVPPSRRSAEPSLTVVSYNIQYGGGGRNVGGIAEAIRSLTPDLVALQEVDVHWSERSDFADQARELANELGMEVRFAPIYDIPDTSGTRPPRQFGVALLSRHHIIAFTNHRLTRLSTQEPNAQPRPQPGLLEATVQVHGALVRVFNAHLDYRADPAVRRQQVAEMLARIGESPVRTIVAGDLNARPDAPELQPLFARLRDAWRDGGPDDDDGFTFPAAAPDRRIDYVLVSDDLTVRSAYVGGTTVSDHRPLVAQLRLAPATGGVR